MRFRYVVYFLIFSVSSPISGQIKIAPLLKPIDKTSLHLREKNSITNSVIAEVNNKFVQKISDNEINSFDSSIPIDNYGTEANLHFSQFDLLNDDFVVLNAREINVDYKKGKYFSVLADGNNALGTFSFYENNLMGMLTYEDGIVYNIGKVEDSKYIIYRGGDFKAGLRFYCDTDDNDDKIDDLRDLDKIVSRKSGKKCINLYVEADYALFADNGKNIAKTVDFVLGLFAESALLYKKEGVNIKIARIKVWDSKDNYDTKSSNAALDQFVANNKNKEMDLGILLALGANGLGGLAYINGLCTHNRHFAYANIRESYRNIPLYSWSAMVISHELGHNLGSRHTHACNWNNNGTQIDDCGNIYLFNNGGQPEGYSCFNENNPILPDDGGTIMSYCHLVGAVGINLSKGFGEQPNRVINRVIENAGCLDKCEGIGDTKPIADFAGQKEFTCVGGEIKFFDKSENHPSEWIWLFEEETGLDTMYHKYPTMRYNSMGSYGVSLISINAAGSDTLYKENYIKVIEGPVANFDFEFIENNRVQFENKSELSNSYFWKFGDGRISAGKNPKHRYKEGGKYIVELFAIRDTCSTKAYFADTIEVKIPYIAKFSVSGRSVCKGDTIVFKYNNEKYDSVKWTFEKGQVVNEEDGEMAVLYEDSGEFDVEMIAFSKYGNDTIVKSEYIDVLFNPVSEFSYTISGDTIFFTNESLNSSDYIWYFNGTISSFKTNPIYKFGNSPEVEVTLVAKNKCDSSVISKQIFTTDIDEFEESNAIFIYPNPNSGKFGFNSDFELKDEDILKIFNIYGNLVYQVTFAYLKKKKGEYVVDIESLKSGLYYMSISNKTNIICKKAFTVIEK